MFQLGAGRNPARWHCNRCCSRVWELVCPALTSPLSRALRLRFSLHLAEIIVLGALVGVAVKFTRLFVVLILLCYQNIFIGSVLIESQRQWTLDELRNVEPDVRAKLWAVGFVGSMPLAWWALEFVTACGARLEADDFVGNAVHIGLSGAVFLLHLCLTSHWMYLVSTRAKQMIRGISQPAKLFAERYGDTQESQRFDNKCCICLSDYEADDTVIVLPCQHLFHADCFCEWLGTGDRCPFRCTGAIFDLPGSFGRDWARTARGNGTAGAAPEAAGGAEAQQESAATDGPSSNGHPPASPSALGGEEPLADFLARSRNTAGTDGSSPTNGALTIEGVPAQEPAFGDGRVPYPTIVGFAQPPQDGALVTQDSMN